jgi:hypothetical protein
MTDQLRRLAAATMLGSAVLAVIAARAEAKITIDIDYSLDVAANNFFNPATANGLAARAALGAATDTFSDRLLDQFDAITPSGGNVFTPRMRHPVTGESNFIAPLTSVPANTIKLYAAGRVEASPNGILGQGGFGSSGGSGSFDWFNFLKSRGPGNSGAILSPQQDFALWGGSISFNTTSTWNYSVVNGPTTGQYDFVSVALHEVAHYLGFGTAESFTVTNTSSGTFIGPKAKAVNIGVAVPLIGASHFGAVTSSVVAGGPAQTPVMTPSLGTNTRRKFTLLDFAALDDIGWELARPGDANADGTVSFPDLVLLAQNYGASARTWSEGDFDYDGTVSFNDLVALAQNYGTTGPLGDVGTTDAALQANFAADWALAQSQVPEPAALASLGCAVALLRRRRRSRICLR